MWIAGTADFRDHAVRKGNQPRYNTLSRPLLRALHSLVAAESRPLATHQRVCSSAESVVDRRLAEHHARNPGQPQ